MSVCSPKPALAETTLDDSLADELAAMFKVVANGTRLRLLHALASKGELCLTEVASAISMKPQAVSNQITRLVERGMVSRRRNGQNVYFTLTDPCIAALLETGICLVQDAVKRRSG